MGVSADILKKFAEDTMFRAKRNLGAIQDRWGIRASWKGKKPVKWKRKKYKGRIVASGRLKASINYSLTDTGVKFSMLGYGQDVDAGRKGKIDAWGIGSNPSAKGAPIQAIQDWMKAKNVKPRDDDGKFIKATDSAKRSTGFLINRKIKWFGQAPSRFFRDAVEQTAEEYFPDIAIARIDDLFNERL